MAVRTYRDAQGRTRYLVEFQQGGKRVCRRCYPGCTRGKAVEYETTLRGEAFDQGALGKRPELTLQDAISRWLRDTLGHKKDQKKPEQNALLLAPFVAGKSLRQVTDAAREAIASWTTVGAHISSRRGSAKPSAAASRSPNSCGASLTPATINRRLCVLKAAAKHAWKQGWIEDNLSGRITLLPEHNKREVYLSGPQVRQLARCAPTKVCSSAILLAAYTGTRAGELLLLTRPKAGASTFYVAPGKSGKPRHVPIAKPVSGLLSALPLALSYSQLRREWLVARAAANMRHVHWHDLRHTFASLLINKGVDLYTVGTLMGHSTTVTTARYAHLVPGTLRKAVAKL